MIDIERLKAQLKKNVVRAAIHLSNAVKVNLNEPAPNRRRHVGEKVYYTADHSAPGELPRKITGFLQRSIAYEVATDGMSAKVGSTLKGRNNYARYLEFGTGKMAARPFLRPTLAQERARIEAILAQGLTQ